MRDVILVIIVVAAMIFGYLIMKRLDIFLERNRKPIEKAQKIKSSLPEFIDSENYENIIFVIETTKKGNKNTTILIFDRKNQEFTYFMKNHKNRFK